MYILYMPLIYSRICVSKIKLAHILDVYMLNLIKDHYRCITTVH